MKKSNLIIYTTIFIFSLACNKKPEESRNRNMYVYYDIYEEWNEKLPVGAYRISNDNECVYYKYDYSTGNRCVWTAEDVVPVNYWKYIGSGNVDIQGYKFIFVGFSKDTILLRDVIDSSIDRFVKSKYQSDSIPRPDRILLKQINDSLKLQFY